MRWLLLCTVVAAVAAPVAAAKSTKPCVLVSASDASKVLGGKVGAGKAGAAGGFKSCTYAKGKNTLTVQTRSVAKAAFEKSAQKGAQPVFPIPGIGDESFSIGGGKALYVWKSGIELRFTFAGISVVVQNQKDVADAALKRL